MNDRPIPRCHDESHPFKRQHKLLADSHTHGSIIHKIPILPSPHFLSPNLAGLVSLSLVYIPHIPIPSFGNVS